MRSNITRLDQTQEYINPLRISRYLHWNASRIVRNKTPRHCSKLFSSFLQSLTLVLRPAGSAITFWLAITCCQQKPLEASNVLAWCYGRSSGTSKQLKTAGFYRNFWPVSPHFVIRRLVYKQDQVIISFLIISLYLAKVYHLEKDNVYDYLNI